MRIKRHFVRNRQYFFTLLTAKQEPVFASQHAIAVLNAAFGQAMRKYPFDMDAIVILPEHLHCIWTLPVGDEDTARRWRVVKFWFSSHCDPALRPRGRALWARRFWEHPIGDVQDYQHHVNFIHYNAVWHGLCNSPAEWPHSSFGHYVQMGWLDPGWGKVAPAIPESIGHE